MEDAREAHGELPREQWLLEDFVGAGLACPALHAAADEAAHAHDRDAVGSPPRWPAARPDGAVELIRTERGVGYVFTAQVETVRQASYTYKPPTRAVPCRASDP